MELIFKCAGAGILSAVCALLLRRSNPEFSFALSAVTVAVLLLAGASLLGEILRALREMTALLGAGSVELRPVLKCLGIASVSRFGADLCRDASQGAVASAVETVGSICALAVAAPVLLGLLTTIGGLL
ncbi:MAG: stage III sporulation protein AD [Oscillospiraceae bacterium]|nr:stage III sporulation protein AD [Oscillospiraceae bacterium]